MRVWSLGFESNGKEYGAWTSGVCGGLKFAGSSGSGWGKP